MDPWDPEVLQEVPGTHRGVPGGFRMVPWDPRGGPRVIYQCALEEVNESFFGVFERLQRVSGAFWEILEALWRTLKVSEVFERFQRVSDVF